MNPLKSISDFFGLDREPQSWPWGNKGRRVAPNELPQDRIGIHEPRQIPGLREVRVNRRGEVELVQYKRPLDSYADDMRQMDNHLRDGCGDND